MASKPEKPYQIIRLEKFPRDLARQMHVQAMLSNMTLCEWMVTVLSKILEPNHNATGKR